MRKIESSTRTLIVAFMAASALSFTGCVAVQAPVTPYAEVDVVAPLPPLEVDVNVSVEAPPPLQFEAAPDVVVIPSGDVSVYMVPNMTGVYFYNGLWYRNYGGYWFQSSIYNGVWAPIGVSFVPQVIVVIPPEYPLYLSRDYQRIRYNDFNRSWREWDRSRHWHNYDWYRRESRAEVRRERFNQIREERTKRRSEGFRKPGGDGHSPMTPGPKQPGVQKPEMRKPEMQKPVMPKPEMQKPEMRKPEMQKPEMRKPEMQKPVMPKPEMQKPEMRQPVMPKPEVRQPVMPKPEMQKPGPRQPGMQQQGPRQPGMQQQGPRQPGMQQQGPRQPGMQQQGPRQPGMQQQGPRQPGMQQQGPRQPGMQQQGPRQPVAKPPVAKPEPRQKPGEKEDKQ
jgi:pentapeptide MXKDX repeat protein